MIARMDRARKCQDGLCKMTEVLRRWQAFGCWRHLKDVCHVYEKNGREKKTRKKMPGLLARIIATMEQLITGGSYAWNRRRALAIPLWCWWLFRPLLCLLSPLLLSPWDTLVKSYSWFQLHSEFLSFHPQVPNPVLPQIIYVWIHHQLYGPLVTSSQHLPDSSHFHLDSSRLSLPLKWMLPRTKATR